MRRHQKLILPSHLPSFPSSISYFSNAGHMTIRNSCIERKGITAIPVVQEKTKKMGQYCKSVPWEHARTWKMLLHISIAILTVQKHQRDRMKAVPTKMKPEKGRGTLVGSQESTEMYIFIPMSYQSVYKKQLWSPEMPFRRFNQHWHIVTHLKIREI